MCLCAIAGTHPKGDAITFKDPENVGVREMSLLHMKIGFMRAEDPELKYEDILAMVREYWVLNFIEAWTLKGPDKKALPVTKPNIRDYLSNKQPLIAFDLADYADDLYGDRVFYPLVRRVLESSLDSPMDDSTSQPPSGDMTEKQPPKRPRKSSPSGRNRTPSEPSSTFTTPMAATTTTR